MANLQPTRFAIGWMIFKRNVNEVLRSDHLQFTCEIWNPDAPLNEIQRNEDVLICRGNTFPYLDMELYWILDELKFKVHLKENKLLK